MLVGDYGNSIFTEDPILIAEDKNGINNVLRKLKETFDFGDSKLIMYKLCDRR